jgi:hypothetical protein
MRGLIVESRRDMERRTRESSAESRLMKASDGISRTITRRLSSGALGTLMACAIAGLALLSSRPAAAQVVICDSDFSTSNWSLTVFACPGVAGSSLSNTVNATQQPANGSISTALLPPASCPLTPYYRDVKNSLNVPGNGGGATCPAESVVYGVHAFSTLYTPASSGAIASISFQIDYQCPDSVASVACQAAGEGFGPALVQGGRYFVANVPSKSTNVTPAWTRYPVGPLSAAAFNEITVTGTGPGQVININNASHPDFSATAPSVQCGFYTLNGTSGGTYAQQAGYDNWSCTITPVGILKVCKVAGPGIAVGTPFGFTANGNPFQVPAGPAPGGTCVVVAPNPGFAVGTTVNIVETPIPTGVAVSNIAVAVAPPGSVVSTNLATGTVSVVIGNGVTEATFTDYRTTGYLEICKTGTAAGSFMVNPGNLGPFAVPVGACSPAIQVTAGPVVITETPNAPGTSINGCTTIPSGRLVSCPSGGLTATVTVVPGDIPSETIVTVNNK